MEARNSFHAPGWGGPCPPPGPPHRYVFTVYALPDAHLPVRRGADPAEAIRAAERRRIDQAALTATFRRS
ncbi:YbhB/YbcL family Raf kinase inhibitor-like protein [Georgenia thermotolerans]|uniref:YbhB/YbcL family Raf kinase inhibitor-like protein n=1 Tax=Georgenia thermotolerans TaxID=527326 RepID=UPI001B8A8DD4